MSKAAKRRRFLRWRKYRRQCELVTGQSVPFTQSMGDAWIGARYRVRQGRLVRMPEWHHVNVPIGTWEKRRYG